MSPSRVTVILKLSRRSRCDEAALGRFTGNPRLMVIERVEIMKKTSRKKMILDSGVFCFFTLVDTESVARLAHNPLVSPPPGRPSPTGYVRAHSDVDAPHLRENACAPRMEHGSSAIVKTPRRQRPPRTTFRSLHRIAPESRPSTSAV